MQNDIQNVAYVVYANQTATEESVTALALSNQNVIGAKCFEYENTFVVAVLATPFYLKSERDKFLQTVQEELCKQTNSQIIVTFDVDIFRKIKPNMTQRQKSDLYEKVTSRL